jgi:ribosomal protein S18 acetylase RimI-like enzyme
LNNNYDIRSLANTSFDELYACHIEAFKDYPFQWSKEALHKTIHRRGYDPSLSFGAFHENKLVAFTWNGIGVFNGVKTAYDTGTGTTEEHRGKGLASKIFEYSIPFLKKAGVQQYILEVLEENEKAYSVYQKQGFEITRKFDCFRTNTADWNLPAREVNAEISLKEIDFGYRPQMEAMIDFPLSWQNDFQALLKKPEDFVVIGAFKNDELVGYGIVEPGSGDISQLAVAKSERRKGIGSMILAELKKINKADIVKVVNIPSTEKGIIEFVTKNSIPKIVSQFEMIRIFDL